jgi:hypothetical protein
MKKLIYLFLLVIFAIACEDETTETRNGEKEVTYEVITSRDLWFGEWFNNKGEREYSQKGDALPDYIGSASGWKYTYKATPPFSMMCHATTVLEPNTPNSPSVTVKLYLDGILVKTETDNWAKGVTTAVYKVQ